ncbi:MAG: hypothetical protein HYV07_32935 [Deltaproteobacteria bacterium]|nr:hypothetical protein [Deltaproteobacteria bacterium]
MDPFSITVLAIGGAIAYSALGRGKRRAAWAPAIEQARARLLARVSGGSDTPELRADLDGREVMLQLRAIHSPEQTVAIAETRLSSEALRLFVGWDVTRVRDDISYIPEVPYPGPQKLSGQVTARADDPAVAERFLVHASSTLLDLRRCSAARALELLARGGLLRIAVHGLAATSLSIERTVTASVELARLLELAASGVELPPIVARPEKSVAVEPASTPKPEPHACALCEGRRTPDGGFVRCKRCGTTYHAQCWRQATGCVAEGCDWIRAEPI